MIKKFALILISFFTILLFYTASTQADLVIPDRPSNGIYDPNHYLSEVVSTDSLKGAVKDAINQKVTNYQIPLVDNYVNALDSIVSRYDELVKLFQDMVSETDNSAIIKTEYLERIKQRMKDPIEGLKSSSSKTQNIYAGISDILTLTNPSLDSVNTSYNQAVKSLDDTIKNMEAFNSVLLLITVSVIFLKDNFFILISNFFFRNLSYLIVTPHVTYKNHYSRGQFQEQVLLPIWSIYQSKWFNS